ncbi:MAG: glycosyltransferase family 39 protein [Candidatus Azambacteria bacterium]|nr:glycosyltransferase family 39 protein [Candidatus Azambacteria bacterium]
MDYFGEIVQKGKIRYYYEVMCQIMRKKSFFIYLIMLGLELVLLILVARHAGWSINPYMTGFDTIEYSTIARNLIENHAFSKSSIAPFIPNFFRSPGYPFWLAFIYLIFGSFKPAIFLGIIIFAFSAPLIYLIMREVFSEKLALWTGIIFALEPRMAFSAPFLLSEQIFMPLFLLAVFSAIKFFNNPQKKKYILLSAVLLGVSTLIRGISLYLWPILAIFFFIKLYKTRPLLEILKILGLATIILILVMSPWLIRNRLTLGTWQSSSLFGVQLYWGFLENLEGYLSGSRELVHQKLVSHANYLVGDNFETPQAISILANSALTEIKSNWRASIKVYVSNLASFFIIDGYKGIASYVVDIKPNYIKFSDFIMKGQFKEALSHLKNLSFLEIIIPIFGRALWAILTFLGFIGIFLSIKKMPQQRPILILFSILIFYFAILTGSVVAMDPRFRMPINGFLFAFALVSIFHIFKINFKAKEY